MSKTVHLVFLSGMGDTQMFLLLPETYKWMNEGGDPPEGVVERQFIARAAEHATHGFGKAPTIQAVRHELKEAGVDVGSSPDNDRAMMLCSGDPVGKNDEAYSEFHNDPKGLMKFVSEHDLDLSDDQYDGYIY